MTILALIAAVGTLLVALQLLVRFIGRAEVSVWTALSIALAARLAGRVPGWVAPALDRWDRIAISLALVALGATLAVHLIVKVPIGRSLVIGLIYTVLALATSVVMVMLLPTGGGAV